MSVLAIPESGLAGRIGHIAAVLESKNFSTGERAKLRRMSPARPPLSFYRFALSHLPDSWEHNNVDWVTLVAGIALMSPNAHRPGRSLGKALAETGYSESRLERLLAAEGDTRRTLLLRAARFLAAKVYPFNWTNAAQLLLTRDSEKREFLHRRIAKDYYQALQAVEAKE